MVALCCYERPRGVVRNSYSSFFIPNYTKICAIFGDITLCSYFCTMRKWIYILLLGFCLYFGQEQVVRAQEGRLEKADVEGTAAYAVELSFEFKKGYEVS